MRRTSRWRSIASDFDQQKNEFIGDDQANRLRSEALREPWRL